MKQAREQQTKRASVNGWSSESAGEGSLWELWLFAILFILVFSAVARADAPAASASSTTKVVAPAKKAFEYSGALLIETSRPIETDNAQIPYSGYYKMTLGAVHPKTKIAAAAVLAYAREYTYEKDDGTDGAWERPIFGLSKSFVQGEEFKSRWLDKVKVGLSSTLPANRDDSKATFMGSVGASLAVEKKISRLSLGQTVSYSRAFFEYDMQSDGKVNSPDVYKSVSEASFELFKDFTLDAALLYQYAVSFQGVGRASQISSLGVSYSFTPQIGASAGIATQRGTLDADGQTNSIRFFDTETTAAFLDLVLSI